MIPTITTETVDNLLQHIKPVKLSGKNFWLIKIPDAFNVSYIWAPELVTPIAIEAVRTIQTLHRYGHPMLFKPSIAEVLAQWPEDLLDGEYFFSTKLTKTDADSLNAGYHVAKTNIFKKRAE